MEFRTIQENGSKNERLRTKILALIEEYATLAHTASPLTH